MSKSAYMTVIDTMREACEGLRGRSYYVRRGAINWTSFPFDKNPKAIAIMVDEATLLRQMNDLRVTLEFACSLPEDPAMVSDALLDEFMEDFQRFSEILVKAMDSNGDAVIHSLDQSGVIAVEFSDSSLQVQGLSVSFRVSY